MRCFAFFALAGAVISGFVPVEAAFAKSSWCQMTKAPVVNIRASTDKISYNFTTSEKSLNGFDVDTINPYGKNVITDVGGLMKGGIETSQSMRFSTLTNPRLREVCYWYDTVDVNIHINPTIYIASEFPQGSCMHNAIMEHEQKHVTVDREMVNKYAQLIGNAIKAETDRQPIYGPVPLAQEKAIEAAIKSKMQSIVTNLIAQMDQERKTRQQVVDNLSEYQRVNALCPDQKKKNAKRR